MIGGLIVVVVGTLSSGALGEPGPLAAAVDASDTLVQSEKDRQAEDREKENLARKYLDKHRREFGLTTDEPLPKIVETAFYGVTFEAQRYHGIEVVGSEIRIASDLNDGGIDTNRCYGRHFEGLSVPTEPRLDKARARDAAAAAIVQGPVDFGGTQRKRAVDPGGASLPTGLVILPPNDKRDRAHLAWEVPVLAGHLPFLVYVDAVTGEIIESVPQYRT